MTKDSVYEILDPLTTIRKTRFWDWFDGNDLKSWWTENNGAGTGTFAMVDAVNEGFSITTDTAASDDSRIFFNDKRHYDFANSVLITVSRAVTATGISWIPMLVDNTSFTHRMIVRVDSTSTFYDLNTRGGGAATVVATTVPTDTTFRVNKGELSSAKAEFTLDGVLEATSSTNLPSVKLQPMVRMNARASGGKEGRVRYLEAFNT